MDGGVAPYQTANPDGSPIIEDQTVGGDLARARMGRRADGGALRLRAGDAAGRRPGWTKWLVEPQPGDLDVRPGLGRHPGGKARRALGARRRRPELVPDHGEGAPRRHRNRRGAAVRRRPHDRPRRPRRLEGRPRGRRRRGTLRRRTTSASSSPSPASTPTPGPQARRIRLGGVGRLDELDLSLKLSRKEEERALAQAQDRLIELRLSLGGLLGDGTHRPAGLRRLRGLGRLRQGRRDQAAGREDGPPPRAGRRSSPPRPTTRSATTSSGASGPRCPAGEGWRSSTAPGTGGCWSSGSRSSRPASSGFAPTTRSTPSSARSPTRARS